MTDQLAQFVTQLQSNGVTLQTYNKAYNNTTHPTAVDAQTQIVQNCGPPPSQKKKSADGDAGDDRAPTTSTEQWTLFITWYK